MLYDGEIKNPEKEQRNTVHSSYRIDELAEKAEKRFNTVIPVERRRALENQVDRLEDIFWLLGK